MTADISFLNELYDIIQERRKNGTPEESYVAKLSANGRKKIAQKVGEEAVETVVAALAETREELCYESADLLFHLLILWADCGLTPHEVAEELYNRQCKIKDGRK